MNWMAWTVPTASFFTTIVLILIAMTVWELKSPSIERRGFLPLLTTRGDRLFIGLLGSAYIHLAFVGFTSMAVWIATIISLLWMGIVMRWG
ncbi:MULTISPECIES: DUF2160 domain-containing protein [Hahella]|uniref:DUF2160 domain-containing protein n=1 Tax=Hahella TaxID=158481 RepID=UPI0002ED10D8|nr:MULTISPECIES: DUF2160 domain-containing protein [Hahella]AZZ95271.1 hypothetical protein ENC22_30310 [Hahella sp. KA22]MBU6951722.1 DUF2160 domain-containing protein [Hahella sp. HN01]MDG9666568.1 DUF2160 domain-containing protein [Hahella sp. CR1]QAY52916.1 hypothetical protein EUZ85_02020 [Hahella sp. KA22]